MQEIRILGISQLNGYYFTLGIRCVNIGFQIQNCFEILTISRSYQHPHILIKHTVHNLISVVVLYQGYLSFFMCIILKLIN